MTAQSPTDVTSIDDWNRLLDGKVAVVTGGGTGIGGAIARLFAQHGALVEIAEIDSDLAEENRSAIETAGGIGASARRRCHRRRRRRPPCRSSARRAWTDRRAREQRGRLPAIGALQELVSRVVDDDVQDQPPPLLLRHARLPRRDDRAAARFDRERALCRRAARIPRRAGIRGDEGRGRSLHDLPGRRSRSQRHPRERHRSRSHADTAGRLRHRVRGVRRVCGPRGHRSVGWAGPRTRPGSRSSSPPISPDTSPATTSRSTAVRRPAEVGSGRRRSVGS